MIERETNFSENERLEIAETARGVAATGEETMLELIHIKNSLMKFAIRALESHQPIEFHLDGQSQVFSSVEIQHEVRIVEEVIKQSQLLLQLEGRDTMSELSRAAERIGWGSLYYPDSIISKKLGTFRD